MDAPQILRYKPADEFFIDEGCHINELSNTEHDEAVSIARARVEPGETTRWHRLEGITERYVILDGEGRVEVGDEAARDIAAGDVVIIPPMCPQRISNSGGGDLVFLAICSPRFRQQHYQDIEASR